MRIARKLRDDQEIISRFIAVLGSAMIELSSNKLAGPGFFIMAYNFISEYIEGGFFKKEELLIKALEDVGFPPDDGPIYFMRSDQKKCREAAENMIKAAKQWQKIFGSRFQQPPSNKKPDEPPTKMTIFEATPSDPPDDAVRLRREREMKKALAEAFGPSLRRVLKAAKEMRDARPE